MHRQLTELRVDKQGINPAASRFLQARFSLLALPAAQGPLGEVSALPAALGCGLGGDRSSSGFCWYSQWLVGQLQGQSQRWSIDVNKTNSR